MKFYKKIKRFIFPKSLLFRFLLILIVPLVSLQLVMSEYFYDNHWGSISRRLALSITGEIQTLITLKEQGIEEEHFSELLDELFDENLSLLVSFYPNQMLQYPLPERDGTLVLKALRRSLQQLKYPFYVEEFLEEKYVLIFVETPKGLYQIRVPQKRFYSSTAYIFILWLIGTSIVVFLISFLFMKNQIRPMIRLAEAADLFGRGRTAFDFKPEGAFEVRRAGEAFLEMKERLQKYLQERTNMLAGISHDLRTPLTRMNLELSMMGNKEEVSDLLDDVSEMKNMIEGYLTFARGEGKEAPILTDSTTLIKAVVNKLRRAGQEIDLHIEGHQDILVRPQDMMRAITNFLSNSNRYAKTTYLRAGVSGKYFEIIVDDDGPGIAKKERKNVFKAFYRLDKSRNSKTGGVGLGLSISRDIILSHGGEIYLEDSPFGGLRVRVLLPL
ncbi:MAG: ATP-binding protein [Alphaproteobacteria bacterium]|nr:ATP-binding protein [Alphaproteobacteria bacterium]